MVVIAICIAGCSSGSEFGQDLIVVAHTEQGKIQDLVVLDDAKLVSEIKVHVPQGQGEIFITLFGEKIGSSLKQESYYGTRVGTGFLGFIEIRLQDGSVIHVSCNSIGYPTPVSKKKVQTEISKNYSKYGKSEIIQITRIEPDAPAKHSE